MSPAAPLSWRGRAHVERGRVREIVTPEGIPIHFTLARAGDRAGAFVIDTLIQFAALLVLVLVLVLAIGRDAEDSWLTPLVILLAFFVTTFYFPFFEVRWQGATPGKRQTGIRVIDARGGQLETSAILARNLVREIEVWMPLRFLLAQQTAWPGAPAWVSLIAGGWLVVFLLLPLFNRDRLRIGDLIAGTRVVMQPKVFLVPDLVAEIAAAAPAAAAPLHGFTEAQLAVYGIFELQVLEDLLRRPPGEHGHDTAVRTVADKIRVKTGYQPVIAPGGEERFLRDFYTALRAHLEQKLLFGKRREDKFAK
jgi:uncharacterized RDD family membrane protein YckC